MMKDREGLPYDLYQKVNSFIIDNYKEGIPAEEADRIITVCLLICANIILSSKDSCPDGLSDGLSEDELFSLACKNIRNHLLEILKEENEIMKAAKAAKAEKAAEKEVGKSLH